MCACCGVLCRVLYKPSPLPPGMEAAFTVELVAEQSGDFVADILVKTELNVFTLSVSAKVLPAVDQQPAANAGTAERAMDSGISVDGANDTTQQQ